MKFCTEQWNASGRRLVEEGVVHIFLEATMLLKYVPGNGFVMRRNEDDYLYSAITVFERSDFLHIQISELNPYQEICQESSNQLAALAFGPHNLYVDPF